jgi:hypothetical protein
MKTIRKKDEIRHGRAQSNRQMRDAMTTASIPNKHITKAMQQSIRGFEKNGFYARRIMPVDPMAGIHAREFRADFAKQTPTGLLVFSVRIDTDGNVTNQTQTN